MATKQYPHASFLRNMSHIPKHWFIQKGKKGKNQPIEFYNAKDHYNTLHISDGLTGVYHIMYDGSTLKVVKTKSQALRFAKAYMRKH